MNIKNYILFALVVSMIVFLNTGCNNKENDKWLGTYKGTSHHWDTYPSEINGQWQLITIDSYKDVSVYVSNGNQDQSLDFRITYNDSTIDSKDIYFSENGVHNSQWGDGSMYGSLNISFESDSLHYEYFQKCGIPCQSGINFDIKKYRIVK